MTVIALPQSDRTITSAWLRHGAVLGALVLLTFVLFRDAVAAAIKVWTVSPTYSHCFLIVPIAFWLAWEKRAALAATAPGLFPQALLVTPLLGLMWWIGQLSAINEVQQYAVIGIVQTLIVALLGLNVTRLIWFPILYLAFLVPTGEYLIAPMQRFAAQFVDISLTLLNITHYTQGTVFDLSNGRYEIAEACAGLRFLIATVTLGVLFSYLMFRKPIKAVLFLLASVTVPLVGNGLRCVGIIVLAHFTNNSYGAGADHIVYGWGFNIAILLVLGALGSLFRDDIPETPAIPSHIPVPATRLAVAAVLAAVLVGAAPAVAFWHDNGFAPSNLNAIANPFTPTGWQKGPSSAAWQPDFSGYDSEASAAVTPAYDVPPVDLFLAYYARSRPGHSVTAHANRFWDPEVWTLVESHAVVVPLAGHPTPFQEWVISTPLERRLVWSNYWVNGQFTTSLFKVKLWQASAALRGHDGQAAFALSTRMDGTPEETRKRLAGALMALPRLPTDLNNANRPAPTPGGG